MTPLGNMQLCHYLIYSIVWIEKGFVLLLHKLMRKELKNKVGKSFKYFLNRSKLHGSVISVCSRQRNNVGLGPVSRQRRPLRAHLCCHLSFIYRTAPSRLIFVL